MSFESSLSNLDDLIKQFEVLVKEYPEALAYQERLARLQQQRADLVSKIGKTNK